MVPTTRDRSSVGRRERKRLDTEQRIMQAALRLFCEHGYADTTVDQIVLAADVAKGTFFNYFNTKERVILAFGERLVGRLATAAVSIAPNTPIREQLRRAVHLLAGEWRGNRRLLRSMLSAALSSDLMASQFQNLLTQARTNVAILMKEGQRRGELRKDVPPKVLARLLQQSMLGNQVVWSLRPASNLDTAVDQTLDALWQGIESPDSNHATRLRARRSS